jgi:hypothetical protein
MNRQNSHFLAHLLLPQRSLVVKLGVSPSRSRSLTRSHSFSSGDSTTGYRPQYWDEVSPHHNYQSTTDSLPELHRLLSYSIGYLGGHFTLRRKAVIRIRCASSWYQVCHFMVSGVPVHGIRCATSWYQACHFMVSGVPLHGIRRAISWYQVCHFMVSGVPLHGIRCATSWYQVCHFMVSVVS